MAVNKVREVMTAAPVAVGPGTPVVEVARLMRDQGIGVVLVAEDETLRGLVTDRDLVVRRCARAGTSRTAPSPTRAARTWSAWRRTTTSTGPSR